MTASHLTQSDRLTFLEQASLQDPYDATNQRLYLEALHHGGKQPEALQLSRTLIKQHSELTLPWLILAQQAEKEGKQDSAELYYSKAISLDAKHLYARAGMALLTMHQLRLPEAIVHFREAIPILLAEQIKPAQVIPRTDFNSPQNESLLWQALATLANNNIHAVAHAGTLLGLVREGSLLPGDKDLDIALPYHEIKPALDCLLQHGWEINPQPMPLTNPISCRHKESGLILDLCGIRLEKGTNRVISGFWTDDPRKDWQRITEFKQPYSIQYEERPEGRIWTLIDPESWLTDLYGDWKIPDPEFDTIIFAKNMRSFSLLAQCYAYNRLIWSWKKGYLTKAYRIAEGMSHKIPDDNLLKQANKQLSFLLSLNQKTNKGFSNEQKQ